MFKENEGAARGNLRARSSREPNEEPEVEGKELLVPGNPGKLPGLPWPFVFCLFFPSLCFNIPGARDFQGVPGSSRNFMGFQGAPGRREPRVSPGSREQESNLWKIRKP